MINLIKLMSGELIIAIITKQDSTKIEISSPFLLVHEECIPFVPGLLKSETFEIEKTKIIFQIEKTKISDSWINYYQEQLKYIEQDQHNLFL